MNLLEIELIATKEFLDSLPDVASPEIWNYVEKKPDFVCKIEMPYTHSVIYNPITSQVEIYRYWESTCYGVSSTDIQYNGHYSISKQFIAK